MLFHLKYNLCIILSFLLKYLPDCLLIFPFAEIGLALLPTFFLSLKVVDACLPNLAKLFLLLLFQIKSKNTHYFIMWSLCFIFVFMSINITAKNFVSFTKKNMIYNFLRCFKNCLTNFFEFLHIILHTYVFSKHMNISTFFE